MGTVPPSPGGYRAMTPATERARARRDLMARYRATARYDAIVRQDLRPLWRTDPSGLDAGVVPAPGSYAEHLARAVRDSLGLKDAETGVAPAWAVAAVHADVAGGALPARFHDDPVSEAELDEIARRFLVDPAGAPSPAEEAFAWGGAPGEDVELTLRVRLNHVEAVGRAPVTRGQADGAGVLHGVPRFQVDWRFGFDLDGYGSEDRAELEGRAFDALRQGLAWFGQTVEQRRRRPQAAALARTERFDVLIGALFAGHLPPDDATRKAIRRLCRSLGILAPPT